MKAMPVVLLAALALGIFVPSVATQERETAGSISITGEAVVKVVPDEVVITLGVETMHANLEVAKRQNDERVKKVIAVARSCGVEDKHIQTDFINIMPQYDYHEERVDEIVGYHVGKVIEITLKDISQFDALLTGALKAGANYVHGIEFRTSQLRKYRDQARALAIQAAQEKAQALAQELGQTLGEPTFISENSSGWWSSYGSWWGSRWGSMVSQNVIQNAGLGAYTSEEGLAAGQISVSASVSVTFDLK
jgi:uncharacterized protein YggE